MSEGLVPPEENLSTDATAAPTVVIVDDDPIVRRMLRHGAEQAGYRIVEFASGHGALSADGLERHVICLDLGLDDMPGMDVINHLRSRDAECTVIVITARRDVDSAVQAMQAGAYDYLVKPIDRDRFVQALHRAIERRQLRDDLRRLTTIRDERLILGSIVGRSAVMREMARQVERVLDSEVTVCVVGESGTGKELVASAIHRTGRRRRGPFVAINCAAIPESLQESELFGHERGAFTGAAGVHRGRFEQANNGTLLLDEVGEMSATTQAALLRALQERSIRRVGGASEIAINVRIVCATHRDLAALVQSGRFRQDLYFRLMVYPVQVPPLRNRIDDIPLLVAHFLGVFADDVGRRPESISANALDALRRYSWPGNVRELQNCVHRAMLACDGSQIDMAHLPPEVAAAALPPAPRAPRGSVRASPIEEPILTLVEMERRAIARALRHTDGSVSKAARLLGIGRATLYRRLAELDMTVTPHGQ